jgi:hypothetical protein
MIREEVIAVWANLKSKLEKSVHLSHQQELIKEALTIYSNDTSFIFSNHSNSRPSDIPNN